MRIPKILYLALLAVSCQTVFSQSVWQGQHHSLRIILSGDLDSAKDSVSVSIPELSYDSLKTKVRREKDSIYLKNELYNFSFKGKFNQGRTQVSGIFNHYAIPNAALVFQKQDQIKPLFFPQHPLRPYPYQVIDMTFRGRKTNLTYGATLTIPNNKKKYPLAVLISGTGKHDRNYTYMGREFFTVLADYLARNGIASLRADDRGIGGTGGDFENATTGDFADDAEEQIAFLKTDRNIDASCIGLIGHSEGGMIASIVSSRNKDVKFMISLSGVGVSGLEMLKLQNTSILKSMNLPADAAAKQMELYTILFKAVYDTKEDQSVKPAAETQLKAWMQQQDSATLKKLQLWNGRQQTFLYRYAKDADRKWYRYNIHYNPEDYLPKITIPVLIANGDKDIQVPAAENIESFKKYLKTGDLTAKIYPGLNHMYQHCTACTPNETRELDEVFAPEVLADISKWILLRSKK